MSESYDGEDARNGSGAAAGADPDGRGPRGRGDGRWPRRAGRGRAPAGAAARLPEELRALGRSLDVPGAEDAGGGFGPESMVERVLGQILAERLPVPVAEPPGVRRRLRAVRGWTRLRWRALTATLCGLLTVLVLTPPVRAAVFDWFGFAGVEVRYDPSAAPSLGAEVPGCERSVSPTQARQRAGFEPLVPGALGTPDAVTVTDGPHGRSLVSLCWHERGRTIRVDEFPARLDLGFTKTVREAPEWIPLGRTSSDGSMTEFALWFPQPHLLRFWLVDADGDRSAREVRTAGPTLLWTPGPPAGELTLRLEGVTSRARAVEIAKSVGASPEKSSR